MWSADRTEDHEGCFRRNFVAGHTGAGTGLLAVVFLSHPEIDIAVSNALRTACGGDERHSGWCHENGILLLPRWLAIAFISDRPGRRCRPMPFCSLCTHKALWCPSSPLPFPSRNLCRRPGTRRQRRLQGSLGPCSSARSREVRRRGPVHAARSVRPANASTTARSSAARQRRCLCHFLPRHCCCRRSASPLSSEESWRGRRRASSA